MTRPNSAPIVKCPSCRESMPYLRSNRWRPFCSERCKSIDLGAWANEQYRVEAKSQDQDSQDLPQPSSDQRH